MDPAASSQVSTIASIAGPIFLALLVWSLKRNVQDADKKITEIGTDVRQLSSTVGTHDSRLAAGTEKFQQIEKRLDGLEERERDRGCFGTCVHNKE